jgi:succinate dehydrogenase / fumarate reductase cytochrome b subunit
MAEVRVSGAKAARPLSPHVSIYRPMLTMMMSIAHRITGAALYVGTMFLARWLLAAAAGPNGYARFQWFMGSFIGQLVLIGCAFALLHHLFGGIRHLIWDLGNGFEPAEREWLTRASLMASVTTTVILVVVGYMLARWP